MTEVKVDYADTSWVTVVISNCNHREFCVYEDFYHLQAKPFRLSPDYRFFYASRGHKRALAYLRYGLSQDEGFIVITGAPGTGKTMLAQILLEEMDQTRVVVAHLTTTQLDADELLRMVAASFGLRYDGVDKPSLLKALEDFLLRQSRERKRVLLVVDEAQNLPPRSIEELRMLSNLQVGNKALLQTFLLGQTQFHQMLERPDLEQFQQRVIANYHLSELAEDECQRYIESRLRHVGWRGDPHYTAAAYEEIYRYTQGIPRRINMLCDRLMLFGFLEETHEIDEALLLEVTDELQREISGKQIGISELSHEHDSLYADHDQPSEQLEITKSSKAKSKKATQKTKPAGKKRSGKKAATADGKLPDSNILSELEAQDKHSAYSLNQNDAKNIPLDPDAEESSLDKVMPEVGYDKLVAQEQVSETGNEDKSGDASQIRASKANAQQTNKDRFQVITGGRNDRRVNKDEMAGTRARSANNPPSEVNASVHAVSGDSDVVLRKILRLVLAYHRSPRSFPGLDDPTQPLPKGMFQILSLAVSDDKELENLRQIAVMGISPAMLRGAVRFFVRRVLFIHGGDDYRVLGLSPKDTLEQVKEHYELLVRIMRQEKQSHEDSSITRIGEAFARIRQGESNHIPSEPPSKKDNDAKELDELDALDALNELDELELDMDLSPKRRSSGLEEMNADPGFGKLSDVITGDQRTAQTSRNIILASGTIVVVFVLYLTQIMGPDEPDVGADIAISGETQGVLESQQQNVEVPVAEAPADQMALTSSVTDEMADTEINNEQGKEAEARRQRILAELRAQEEAAEAKEKARSEAEAIERARLDAKRKQAAAEAKARRAEAAARSKQEARARAEAIATKQAQAEAKARAAARKASTVVAVAPVSQGANVSNTQTVAQTAGNQTSITKVVPVNAGDARISELNSLVSRLENTYAAGDLEAFLSLFAKTVHTNDQTDLAGIRGEYKDLFASTASRKISLTNIDWELNDNYSRGVGGYKVRVRNNGASSSAVLSGSITLQFERNNAGRLQITRFYFSDAEPVAKVANKSGPLASINELNQVLEDFASAYRAGDINQFMALFGADAKTNDRSTLQGIRDDYVGLYASTQSRKIDFSAVQWQREGGISRGEGTYIVKVQPNGKGEIDVYRGKIQFTIGRYDDKLLLTYFAFK